MKLSWVNVDSGTELFGQLGKGLDQINHRLGNITAAKRCWKTIVRRWLEDRARLKWCQGIHKPRLYLKDSVRIKLQLTTCNLHLITYNQAPRKHKTYNSTTVRQPSIDKLPSRHKHTSNNIVDCNLLVLNCRFGHLIRGFELVPEL